MQAAPGPISRCHTDELPVCSFYRMWWRSAAFDLQHSREISANCILLPAASNWPVEGDEWMNLLRPYVALTINNGNRTTLQAGYDVPHNSQPRTAMICNLPSCVHWSVLSACGFPFKFRKIKNAVTKTRAKNSVLQPNLTTCFSISRYRK